MKISFCFFLWGGGGGGVMSGGRRSEVFVKCQNLNKKMSRFRLGWGVRVDVNREVKFL